MLNIDIGDNKTIKEFCCIRVAYVFVHVALVAEDDPPLYKIRVETGPGCLQGRELVELLIELFWEVRESKHLAAMPLPLAHFYLFIFFFQLCLNNNFVYRSNCVNMAIQCK